eukprot:TRINITY_DN14211_c0_g1_i3.p1 TRINITY_DN14211_c0_g1~~TRINITY_DN14211_c0_g1_i3.p1  ORF type:complete len:307 (+),score=53.15 TRINITY_DN14211_c0_g1_i3:80-1000(+)
MQPAEEVLQFFESLRAAVKDAEEGAAALARTEQAKLQDALSEITQQKAELDKLRVEVAQSGRRAEQKLEELRHEKSQVDDQLKKQDVKINAKREQNRKLMESIRGLQAQLGSLKVELKAAKLQIQRLKKLAKLPGKEEHDPPADESRQQERGLDVQREEPEDDAEEPLAARTAGPEEMRWIRAARTRSATRPPQWWAWRSRLRPWAAALDRGAGVRATASRPFDVRAGVCKAIPVRTAEKPDPAPTRCLLPGVEVEAGSGLLGLRRQMVDLPAGCASCIAWTSAVVETGARCGIRRREKSTWSAPR